MSEFNPEGERTEDYIKFVKISLKFEPVDFADIPPAGAIKLTYYPCQVVFSAVTTSLSVNF